MNAGQTADLGEGVFLHYNGEGFEIRTTSPTQPTEVVYLGAELAQKLVDSLTKVLHGEDSSDE